jgi:uncharacterized protein (TIGR00645 family)
MPGSCYREVRRNIFAVVPALRTSSSNDTFLVVLSFLELTVLADIVLIVGPAGRRGFVDPLLNARSEDQPAWIALGSISSPLMGSLAAVTAIAMRESSLPINSLAAATPIWQLAIAIGLGVPGMVLAARNRLDRELSKE